MGLGERLFQVAIGLDQLANVLAGLVLPAGGWADESISARAYRCQHDARGWRWVRVTLDVLAWPLQTDHCRKAYESEQSRRQLPPEYRG